MPDNSAWFPARLAVLSTVLAAGQASGQDVDARLSFLPQTPLVDATLGDHPGATVAVAGRADDGSPRLALLRHRDGQLDLRDIELPDNAVAIDKGESGDGRDAIFVLCDDRVLRLTSFDRDLETVVETRSLFRGRSYAEITGAINFAADMTGDGHAELLIQDFDELYVFPGPDYASHSTLALPSMRRGFDRVATYRSMRVAAANADGGRALMSVRGDTLLRFDGQDDGYVSAPAIVPLDLGLSDEREIEAFYNGYDSIDQSQFVLREPEMLIDVNDDGMADLVTLETRSSGLFDKESTYRVHVARSDDGKVRFDAEPDTVLSSRGFQFGLRAVPIAGERMALVTPGVQIGLRAIIGALFTRSVTLQIAIHAPDESGVIPGEPNTVVRTRIKFDFGTGRAELPTITFGDFDGDGLQDLLLKRSDGDIVWRRNAGYGQFEREERKLAITGPSDGTAVMAVDMDGDGRSDVIALYSKADGEDLDGVVRLQLVDDVSR